jgi:K+/H+ antiporter YhaU regulatory subunit KhtT
MKFKELINFISDDELAFLEAETKVNHQVKKLDGTLVFKLLLFSLLEHGKPSLRVMEEIFHSSSFRFYANKENLKTKYNSLSDRLSSINADFFEEIFRLLFEKFNRELGEETALQKYDSTMVAISSRLVEWGMTVGRKSKKAEKKQLKITIGLHGSLPCDFKIFHQQKYNCEDLTIPQVILNYRNNKSSIVTFDRGVQKRQTFVQFNEQNILFVTRIKTNARHHIIDQILASEESKESESLVIEQDLKVNFNDWETRTRLKTTFRLIKARVKSTGEMMHFVSNNFELTALEITEIYRKRWEIESFFRFIKQELNFSQLINRNLNGVKVMIYMTLILASLIIVYKKKNQLKGYKIVKQKITNEIQQELIREIVILSGGNPDNISYIFDD